MDILMRVIYRYIDGAWYMDDASDGSMWGTILDHFWYFRR